MATAAEISVTSLLDLGDDILSLIGFFLTPAPPREATFISPYSHSSQIKFYDTTQNLRAVRATCRRLRSTIKLSGVNLRLTTPAEVRRACSSELPEELQSAVMRISMAFSSTIDAWTFIPSLERLLRTLPKFRNLLEVAIHDPYEFDVRDSGQAVAEEDLDDADGYAEHLADLRRRPDGAADITIQCLHLYVGRELVRARLLKRYIDRCPDLRLAMIYGHHQSCLHTLTARNFSRLWRGSLQNVSRQLDTLLLNSPAPTSELPSYLDDMSNDFPNLRALQLTPNYDSHSPATLCLQPFLSTGPQLLFGYMDRYRHVVSYRLGVELKRQEALLASLRKFRHLQELDVQLYCAQTSDTIPVDTTGIAAQTIFDRIYLDLEDKPSQCKIACMIFEAIPTLLELFLWTYNEEEKKSWRTSWRVGEDGVVYDAYTIHIPELWH